MKKICLTCGEKIFLSNRKKFCSQKCCQKFHRRLLPLSVDRDFQFFQSIVAAAETPDEFHELYKKYFTYEEETK